jgi:hypothetical protein
MTHSYESRRIVENHVECLVEMLLAFAEIDED